MIAASCEVITSVRNRIITTGTEDTEISFCLSGDADKKKLFLEPYMLSMMNK